ncbi:hypothetical protein [Acidimangrovimonas pyrenivorans]|uniref:Uncharacterized protein n=1 Tax=Acidimangrovimonas pyrenivorans TaxID=2030798 RepID=A0ABV7AKF4_9RHOB
MEHDAQAARLIRDAHLLTQIAEQPVTKKSRQRARAVAMDALAALDRLDRLDGGRAA